MPDLADLAEITESRILEAGIAAARGIPAAPNNVTTCFECDGEIEPARKTVLPYTTYCAACAHIIDRLREQGF